MTSNLLSRLLPTNAQGRSIYDDLRIHDEESDLEEQAGLALDEENLRFRDDELGTADAFGEESRITTESTAFLPTSKHNRRLGRNDDVRPTSRSKWMAQSPRLLEEDGDDDVPASLLVEGNEMPAPITPPAKPRARQGKAPNRHTAIPGPSNRETRAHWEAAQAQQRLHREDNSAGLPQPVRHNTGPLSGSPHEMAMWRWINVVNLDSFMEEVYEYYTGAGIWCIVLEQALDLV